MVGIGKRFAVVLPKHVSPKKQGANQIHRVERGDLLVCHGHQLLETSWHVCRTKPLVPGGLAEEPPPDHVSMMVAQLTKVAVWKRFRVCDEFGLGQEESGAPARPHVNVADGTAVPEPRSERKEPRSERMVASWCFGLLLMRCDVVSCGC